MSIAPGSSRVVTMGGASAAPNNPNGKIFGSTKDVKSFTINPFSPLEAGRTVSGNGVLDRASSASSIAGNTAAT
jgi:hypothetical protein